ncbi:MAG: hypothetical protein WA865_15900 [Spirulinaceae cyanobacterium]
MIEDDEPKKTYHVKTAVNKKACEEMAKKYNQRLVDAVDNGDPILSQDCLFYGSPFNFQEEWYDNQEN